MNRSQETDLNVSLEQSRSGLRDGHRRSLMRILFLVTACALGVFGLLQLLNNNPWFALFEFIVVAIAIWGRSRINATPHIQRWVYGYLIAAFTFTLVIMVIPNASDTAYVWLMMIPVLAYLLLGKRDGFRLSLPFLLIGCGIYGLSIGRVDSALVLIDLLNLVLCAILMLCFVHIYEIRREAAEQTLFSIAQTDSLTGLSNRANFQAILARTVAECSRSGSGFALVVMDVDHFKAINDTMGHDAGDFVLARIGKLLTERLRTTDAVGRLGGEEFGLILRDVKPADSFELMDELRQRIADTELVYGDATITLTASFGIAHYPEDANSIEALYQTADRWLYAGKDAGRNVVAGAAEQGAQSRAS